MPVILSEKAQERQYSESDGGASLAMRPRWEQNGKIPIIFSEGYDFRILERLERRGPFNPRLRSQAFGLIAEELGVRPDQIYTPKSIDESELGRVHSREYLNSLTQSTSLFPLIMGLPDLATLPPNALKEGILGPILLATGGTVMAFDIAERHGWAINLSGGFHHAKREQAGGFCFIADTALGITKYLHETPQGKVLYVDLDAHHGDGVASYFSADPRVAILDIYNRNLYPYQREGVPELSYDIPVDSSVSGHRYLELLGDALVRAFREQRPTLVVYNAGNDIFSGDRFGQMTVSAQAIQDRDKMVYCQTFAHGAKLVQVLSGGYAPETPRVIADSISNLRYTVFA